MVLKWLLLLKQMALNMASGMATAFLELLYFCMGEMKTNLYDCPLSVVIFQFVPQNYILHALNLLVAPISFISVLILLFLICVKFWFGKHFRKGQEGKAVDLTFEYLAFLLSIPCKYVTNKYALKIVN